ncbi:dual specificity phosphatase [Chlorella sorokiniana]|uniref:Dual specificity phosphatase n=1 Tax=Chlorella sorokiniana TaxID=3076 RepID=A0A2P6TGT8_CHLSO|nr:dual specificity phosphatase [Chlorella sorokiniana]|eukprot:PRW33334.1 dual specificity phosphatase [Chlorella sorokiniana]
MTHAPSCRSCGLPAACSGSAHYQQICSATARVTTGTRQRRGSRGTQATAAAGGSSNLGVLAPLAAPEPAEFVPLPPEQLVQFSGGGVINVDGGAIAASLLCLALVLALSLNRILGLERLWGKWLLELREQRQYERRNEVIAARQALEQQFTAADDDEGSSGGSGGGGGSGSGGGSKFG